MATKPERIICDNGCYKATRVAARSFRSTSNSIGIVAIDFGTTHCSVSHNVGGSTSEGNITLLKIDDDNSTRVPSCILFDTHGKRKSFGKKARDQYMKLSKEVRPDHAFFERVKKEIQRKENVDRNYKIQAMNGKEFFLIDVIAHILCHLKETLLRELNDFAVLGNDLNATDIDWVITVPAIWKARGKRMMREAGYMAGLCGGPGLKELKEAAGRVQPPPMEELNPEKLSLALEPESAAIECKKIISNSAKKNLKRYMIVDGGGGTVDIATHEVIDGHIHEIAPSAGNMSGGTTINERFQEFLSIFVDDPGFDRYLSESDPTISAMERAKRISEINKIVYTSFEDQKMLFGKQDESDDDFVFDLSYSFAEKFGDVMENKAAGDPNVNIDDDGMMMSLTHAKMAEFFQPTTVEICKLICNHIRTNNLAMIDAVFWVGGFGGCKYLRSQLEAVINREFNKGVGEILYSKPMEPQLAVVRGALAFRCDPSVVQRRKADATYGIACRIPFKSIHRKEYCEKDEDDHSKKWCKNIFSTFIERKESICTNEVFVANYSPLRRSQKVITLTFYSTLNTNVWYTTDPGVTELAKMDVNIAGDGLDRDIEVVFDVTHTEIQVCARDKQSKNEYKIVVDFLFSQ